MSEIKQISHTEYDSDVSSGVSMTAPDAFFDRLFDNPPAFKNMNFIRRRVTARQVLSSQEVAAHHRHGFYHRYIGSLARVGLNSSFIHHIGGETGMHKPENIPREALKIFARAVYLRGDELNDHPVYHGSQGASAELGYVPQFADWIIDEDLNETVSLLPDDDELADIGVRFDAIHENIGTNDIHYKAKITDNPDVGSLFPAITLSRIRPVADLGLRAAGRTSHTLQVVKRSTFAFSPELTDKEGLQLTDAFLEAGMHKGNEVGMLGRGVIERSIAQYRQGIIPADTFPAESLYFAILRKRSVK